MMGLMSPVLAFVRRRPVLSYFGLTFTIAWGGVLALAALFGMSVLGGSSGSLGSVARVGPLAALVLMAWFAGPSVSSVLLTALVDGRAGLRELRSRLLRWRVAARWYIVALLPAPVLVAAVLLVLSSRSAEFVPAIVTTDDRATLLIAGITWGLVGGGFLEELGWTGFAVPRLRRRHGALTTALVVGAMWGALHFILVFWGGGSMAGEHALPVFLLAVLCFYEGVLPAYRVLMVWVHDRTGSLPVVMLMHASLSASTLILQPPAKGLAFLAWNFTLAIVLWGVVAAIAAMTRLHGTSPSSAVAFKRLPTA